MAEKSEKDEVDAMKERMRTFMTAEGMDWDIIFDLKEAKNEKFVAENCWEFLITVVECVHNCTEDDCKTEEIVNKGENILHRLALSGNPKEMVLGLLEQMGSFEDPVTVFRLFARPLQSALLRVTGKRAESLCEVLRAFCRRLEDLPVPKNHGYSEKELLLLDLDPDVRAIDNATREFKVFLEPFVEGLRDSKDPKAKRRVAGYVMRVLDRPLFATDLSNVGKAAGTLRSCAETMVSYLKDLETDFFSFGERAVTDFAAEDGAESDDEAAEGHVTKRSLATLFYLVVGEGVCKDHLPWVTTASRVAAFTVPLATVLLNSAEECAVFKGLALTESVSDLTANGHLTEDNCDLDDYYEVLGALVKVAVSCGVEESRKRAVKSVRRLALKFSERTRFFVLKGMLVTNSHSGVLSLATGLLKDCLAEQIAKGREVPGWFGTAGVLKIAMRLPFGVETDIQEDRDRLMATLNFLRYLFLTDDRSEDLTGVWGLLGEVLDFVAVLRRAVELSRAHFQLEYDNRALERGDGKGPPRGKGHFLGENEMKVLRDSITSFDLMDSVLVRLSEIIDARK